MAITTQEAWLDRGALAAGVANGAPRAEIPAYVSEIVEEVAFQARQDRRVDKRSGVSQRLPISVMENVLSNAERRAVVENEPVAVPRVTDLYSALPSMTGKFELEYEGELKGADVVARELVRGAVASVAEGYLTHVDPRQVIEWFDLGGSLQLGDTISAADLLARAGEVQGLVALAHEAGVAEGRVRAGAGGRDRLRARGLVCHAPDQPQRGTRLPRGRAAGAAAGTRGDPAGRGAGDAARLRRRQQEEVLQLIRMVLQSCPS